jgi:SPP1 gp7 family putative phage head morphogenesis protein
MQRSQVGQSTEAAWTNTYIQSAYRQGVERGREELKQAHYDVPDIEEQGGLDVTMTAPFHAERVGLAYTRTFNELRGITDRMDQEISRELSQGLAEGRNPNEMARSINRRVDVSLSRARTLARTETIRAHHQATVQEYRNWGAEGVTVEAEWQTAGDARVCPRCASRQGQVYDLDEIEGMIPLHPNCRCIALPVDKTESQEEPVQEADSVDQDPVARRFENREDGEVYLQEKAEARRFLDEDVDQDTLQAWRRSRGGTDGRELDRLAREELDVHPADLEENIGVLRRQLENYVGRTEGFRFLERWQDDPQTPQPLGWKRAAQYYGDDGEALIPNDSPLKPEDLLSHMPEKAFYMRTRALNQAYMEKMGVESEELYRGIGGRTGARIAEALRSDTSRRNLWPVQESSLAGFSSNKEIAESFAKDTQASGGGVYYTDEVTRDEIFVHRDLLMGITSNHTDEEEFIVLGGKKTLPLENFHFGGE